MYLGHKQVRKEAPRIARFLTFSCRGRLPLFQNDKIKRLFLEILGQSRERLGFRLRAWVVMPEHVHLILVPRLPGAPVPVILQAVKQPVARRVIHRWRQLNAPILARITDANGESRFWLPGGGYDRASYSDGELFEKIRYIHENPVRRGLTTCALDYEWSSARWYVGRREDVQDFDPLVPPPSVGG